MGIRDMEAVDALARDAGFAMIDDVADAGQQPHAGLAAPANDAAATPVLLAWSGGKDSTLALERLLGDRGWRVVGLVTTVTAGYDRIAIHGVRRSILHRQVDGLGLPLFEAEIPPQASNEVYEAAFARALDQARAALRRRARHDRIRRSLPRGCARVPRSDARAARLARTLSALGRRHGAARAPLHRPRLSRDSELRRYAAARRGVLRARFRRGAARRSAAECRSVRREWRVPHLRTCRPAVADSRSSSCAASACCATDASSMST